MHGRDWIWRHVVVNTLSSWLHGDARGFRSRGHRIHSSGDYRSPPPAGEHAGLYRYQKERSAGQVVIPASVREAMGRAFVGQLEGMGWGVAVVSVSDKHLHGLVKLPRDRAATRRIVGEAKKVASRAVRRELPGRVWSAGGVYKPVRDARHLREVIEYIRTRQEEGARVIVVREAVWEG